SHRHRRHRQELLQLLRAQRLRPGDRRPEHQLGFRGGRVDAAHEQEQRLLPPARGPLAVLRHDRHRLGPLPLVKTSMTNLKSILLAAAALATLGIATPARASFFFDSNTPDVKWKTFETEHFIFHYYESTSKSHPGTTAFTARRAAKYGEIMYPKV